MALIPENCWTVAAGDTDRSYADICLKHNVVIMGPGNEGSLWDHPNWDKYKEKYGPKSTGILKRFFDMQIGDLVILRLGLSEIHGVGYVTNRYRHDCDPWQSRYGHSDFFADIDGWDLQHYHQVRWIWKKPDGKPQHFEKALNFGDTTQAFYRTDKNACVFDWIESLADDNREFEPKPFPDNKEISVHDVTSRLYDYGIGSGAISQVDERISDLCRLAQWYQKYNVHPSEAETVSHLVTPLLLSLGWSPQSIALEYPIKGLGRADLALFPNGNRKDYEPIAIIEAKKLGQSCLSASEQIKNYASKLEYVRRLIVTDGIRYGLFTRADEETEFSDHLTAYMNLARLRDRYPVYSETCGGADETMLTMSASWSHRFREP